MLKRMLFLIMMLMILAACGADDEQPSEGQSGVDSAEPATLTLMTHDSFDISEEVLLAFEEEYNANIELLAAGDTGTALNQAILAANEPLADVFYGVDNTFLSRALNADIFEPYQSPLLDQIPARFDLDGSHRLLPVDYGDVCLNYDVSWFEENGLAPPDSLDDLIDPAYRGLLVVENPATSSPGLAFLLTTLARYGTEGDYTYLTYWADLRENEVLVTNDWNNAYYGHFSATGDGNRPLVVSYASSPPAEVIFAEEVLEEAPTASVVAPGTCFRQIEFVGILKGTEQRELAEAWVDFMLGEEFQAAVPLHMFVFPVRPDVELPAEFVEYAQVPEEPVTVDPQLIEENRELWIESWSDVVLR